MRFGAILFDLDGTLLDTAPDFIKAARGLAEAMGRQPPDEATVRKAITHGSKGILEKAFCVYESDPEFDQTRQHLLTLYLDCLADQTRPFPGIAELLSVIQRHQLPWGIVTNKPLLYTQAILRQLPLHPAPDTLVCPDHVTRTKPDPEPVNLACSQLAVAPEETLYIGDHIRDIQAGLAAGATTIAAAYGYLDDSDNPETWGAHHVVYHASEITELL